MANKHRPYQIERRMGRFDVYEQPDPEANWARKINSFRTYEEAKDFCIKATNEFFKKKKRK